MHHSCNGSIVAAALQGLAAGGQEAVVAGYVKAASHKSERERSELQKDKTGVFTGEQPTAKPEKQNLKRQTENAEQHVTSHALNPAIGEPIPIWVAHAYVKHTSCMYHTYVVQKPLLPHCLSCIAAGSYALNPATGEPIPIGVAHPYTNTLFTCHLLLVCCLNRIAAGSYALNPATGEPIPIWVAHPYTIPFSLVIHCLFAA
jgi:leucyl-tRNA synthetase